MERKVGEIFSFEEKTYKVVPGAGCDDCVFNLSGCNKSRDTRGKCSKYDREDNTDVIFVDVSTNIDSSLPLKSKRNLLILLL